MATDTRDIAVAADTKIDAHVVDCLQVRMRNEAKLDNIDAKLDKLMWYILPIFGGVILIAQFIVGHFR